MKRKFIFRGGSDELILPVTPSEYSVENGINVEVVNIHTLGDALLAGYGTLATIKISCMFPVRNYVFSSDDYAEQYIQKFKKWVKTKKKIRFIIGGTGVNVPVIIENFSYDEKDGTNDIYAEIILREYRQLSGMKMKSAPKDSKPRKASEDDEKGSVTEYTAKYGDTLCSICRKFYGNDSPTTYTKLADYNGKPNPNLLMTGEVLKIPKPLK